MCKLMLRKTIEDYLKEAREQKEKSVYEERYGSANYFMGKQQAYKDVLDLLDLIKKQELPFDLI